MCFLQDEYSILNSKHFIGIHGYIIVYSVASKQSFEMARVIRDKILNHLVSTTKEGEVVCISICALYSRHRVLISPAGHRERTPRHRRQQVGSPPRTATSDAR
jgi:hypothetical protein